MNLDNIFIIFLSPNKYIADVIPCLFISLDFILIVIILSLFLFYLYCESILHVFLFIEIVFFFFIKTKIFSNANSAIDKCLNTVQVIFLIDVSSSSKNTFHNFWGQDQPGKVLNLIPISFTSIKFPVSLYCGLQDNESLISRIDFREIRWWINQVASLCLHNLLDFPIINYQETKRSWEGVHLGNLWGNRMY